MRSGSGTDRDSPLVPGLSEIVDARGSHELDQEEHQRPKPKAHLGRLLDPAGPAAPARLQLCKCAPAYGAVARGGVMKTHASSV